MGNRWNFNRTLFFLTLFTTAFSLRAMNMGAEERREANTQSHMSLEDKSVEQDIKEAANWFQKAAEEKDDKAQYNLGQMYYHGDAVTKNLEEAFRQFQKAADQGLAHAQFNLGVMYYYGEGVEQDRKEAEKWFEKAAAQGDEEALKVLKSLKKT